MKDNLKARLSSRYAQEVPLLALLIIVVVALQAMVLIGLVLLYNMMGHSKEGHDTLAISITTLEVIIAIFAVFGFWTIRGVAIQRAKETAEAELERYLREDGQALIIRTVLEAMPNFSGENDGSDDTDNLRNELDDEDE